MQDPVGRGEFKFRQVVSRGLQMRQDRRDSYIQTPANAEFRSSVISKFKEMTNRAHSKLKQEPHLIPPMHVVPSRTLRRQKSRRYELVVSSESSSFSSFSLTGSPGRDAQGFTQNQENKNAQLNMRQLRQTLVRKVSGQQLDNPIMKSSTKLAQIVQQNQHVITSRRSPDKQRIYFLRGLQQNKKLGENVAIDEYYDDGNIIVNMKCKDFLTFMRLQHEVEELKRKKNDFDEQKERHFNLAKGDTVEKMEKKQQEKIIQQRTKRYTQSWITGIALAKRFFRKFKAKSEQKAKERHQTLFIPQSKQSFLKVNSSMQSDDAQSMRSSSKRGSFSS